MPIWFRVALISLTIASIIIWIGLAVRHRRQWLYSVPPLLWLFNLLGFALVAYGNAIGICTVNAIALNIWASAISLLAVILTLGIGLVWLIGGTPYHDIS